MVEHYCEEGQTLVPVEVTRREFEAIQEFRKNAQPDEESDSPIVVNAALKVLAMIRSQTHSGAPDGDVTTDAQQDPMLNDSDDVVHDYGLEDGVY
jgi:hypothetical protein